MAAKRISRLGYTISELPDGMFESIYHLVVAKDKLKVTTNRI